MPCLQTADGEFHQFKVDILAGLITYSSDKNLASNLETITAAACQGNHRDEQAGRETAQPDGERQGEGNFQASIDLLDEADLSRFDKAKKKKNNKNKGPQQQQGDKPRKGDNRAARMAATASEEERATASQTATTATGIRETRDLASRETDLNRAITS